MWMGLNLNPHPLKTEGAAPNYSSRRDDLADMGRSVLRPYTRRGVRLVSGGGRGYNGGTLSEPVPER